MIRGMEKGYRLSGRLFSFTPRIHGTGILVLLVGAYCVIAVVSPAKIKDPDGCIITHSGFQAGAIWT